LLPSVGYRQLEREDSGQAGASTKGTGKMRLEFRLQAACLPETLQPRERGTPNGGTFKIAPRVTKT